MRINTDRAKNIVKSLSDSITEDIYIFDDIGQMIASSVQNVDASKKEIEVAVLKQNQHNHISIEDGMIFTIVFRGSVSGFIMLVGDKEDIDKVKNLVMKIIDMILNETMYYQRKLKSAENRRLFIRKAIAAEKSEYYSLSSFARIMGYDIDDFKYLAIIQMYDIDKIIITSDLIMESIGKIIPTKHLITEYNGRVIILLANATLDMVTDSSNNIKVFLEEKYSRNISVGISDEITPYSGIKKAYYQASKALDLGMRKHKSGLFPFQDYSIELILVDVDNELAINFVEQIFGQMNAEEIEEISHLIDVYIENNSSLTSTSKKLFVHKNTLQYRLNKVKELTGCDPRNTIELYKLYTAIRLYEGNYNKNEH